MPFGEPEHTDTLCGQNAEIPNAKSGDAVP
jgi:hypothetical protein